MNKSIQTISNQQGAALITALFLLVVLTLLALSSMNTNIMDEKMAANSQEKQRAFRAAEVGIELAYDDEEAFSTTNTDVSDGTGNDPYDKSSNNMGDYGANVSYNSVYIQKTKPPRGSGWDSTMSFYHFALTATSSTTSGITNTMTQGAYQVGRDDGA
ncbi:MAG: pilus assembly PilX N-terminal domain-containing protein [Gammaproteobacteria bacterium]